jgi:hypothetical protein
MLSMKKFPIIQIRLSTAIAMMFTASALLWLNFYPLEEVRTNGSESSEVSPAYAAQLIWEKRNEIDWSRTMQASGWGWLS